MDTKSIELEEKKCNEKRLDLDKNMVKFLFERICLDPSEMGIEDLVMYGECISLVLFR